jgi:creatinine amidohydrolase
MGAAGPMLEQATWPQVVDCARRTLVVPVGALEQHGPHLPLDTDTQIAVAVASRATSGRTDVALAPAIPYGSSGEHAAFPGTLSIGTAALTTLLVELGRDAGAHWAAVLFVNGHGGNAEALRDAVAQLRYEGRRCDVFHIAPAGADAHAGHAETSMLLCLNPAVVRLELAQRGETRPLSQIIGQMRRGGVRDVSPTGVLGDPRCATADDGRRLLRDQVVRCRRVLDTIQEAVCP